MYFEPAFDCDENSLDVGLVKLKASKRQYWPFSRWPQEAREISAVPLTKSRPRGKLILATHKGMSELHIITLYSLS